MGHLSLFTPWGNEIEQAAIRCRPATKTPPQIWRKYDITFPQGVGGGEGLVALTATSYGQGESMCVCDKCGWFSHSLFPIQLANKSLEQLFLVSFVPIVVNLYNISLLAKSNKNLLEHKIGWLWTCFFGKFTPSSLVFSFSWPEAHNKSSASNLYKIDYSDLLWVRQ